MALSLLSVQRKPHVLVGPARPTPHEFKSLSDIDDQEPLRFHVPIIQYYKNNPKMKGRDPAKVIKEALSKALMFYYPFAGRLREGPRRKLTVECTCEGVLFIEADANVKLEDLGDQLLPPLPWLKEVVSDVPGSDGLVGCPLLLLFQLCRLLTIFNEEIASGAVKVNKIEIQNPKLKYARKPQQKNNVDCGLYVCKYMEWLAFRCSYDLDSITERSISQMRATLAYNMITDKEFGWDERATSMRDKIVAGQDI